MNRVAALLLLVFTSTALAQPAQPKQNAPKRAPAKKQAPKPADPYAEAPAEAPEDPYAEPKTQPAKKAPAKKGKPGKPGKPADPYAEPPKPDKPVDPYAAPEVKAGPPPVPTRVAITDTTAVQGLLAVQRLGGWLLVDRDNENPIARRIVAPDGNPSRPWFYLVPARGQPIALVHESEKRSFEHLPGSKLTYKGYKELDKHVRAMLKGIRSVAVEYSPKGSVPNVSRIDAGTFELIRATGVQVRSSATLVQYTKAIWGDEGRTAHYVAAHHLIELRKDAFAFIAKQVAAGAAITDYDVQQRIARALVVRGLRSTAPVVASGVNTADPYYVPTAAKNAPIRRGDLIVISLAAKLDKPAGVWAAQTWVAVADSVVRDEYAKAFQTVTLARDHALSLITDRTRKFRPVTGAEVDQAVRAFIKKAGFADNVMHRTGHSLDDNLQGAGADLDDFETRDTRILTPGTGFTVGPGVYFPGQFGVRTEVSVYLAPSGPEITTPAQDVIETLLR